MGAGSLARQKRVHRELVAACYEGLDSFALRRRTLELFAQAVPIDADFFATTDPATLLHTSAISSGLPAESSSRFLHNELAEADVNKFRSLAHARIPVDALDRVTGGDRLSSPRYAEILRPLGFGDELRAALRTRNGCWGVLCLHREDSANGFTAEEVEFLSTLVPHLAEGLRRTVLAEGAAVSEVEDGPGVALIDEEGGLAAATPAATRWLAELADADQPRRSGLPVAALAVLERLKALDTGEAAADEVIPRVTARTAAGRWVVLHASRLTGSTAKPQATLVIEPAGPLHLAETIVAAFGLTPRESDITERLLRGLPVKRIATECRISSHTVRDHCKAIFEKVGVNSRGELAATVFRMTSASRPVLRPAS
jgi:DNA-binding CsgD family transcriptional regulator/GAF domain-containing protein